MGEILELSPIIANQIAAGEVVNRPASVVKELVENAVDAGARNITLHALDAGGTLIQIIDDGKGMSVDDAKMAFKRHATSKIKTSDDLWHLQTFGFRGEALASIASVAQVEMKTRRECDEIGVQIRVDGGTMGEPQPVQCPVGTSISIRNLFYNTPARRKFLKSASYERQVLTSEFEKVAMANPHISFALQNENDSPLIFRVSTLRERVGAIIKKAISKSLVPVSTDTEFIKIKGWVSAPSQSGKNPTKNSHFFVNGRFMRSNILQKAVANAYGSMLAPGMHPYFYLFIDIDPTKIDINIHPTKTEIKFENESDLWQLINASVRRALGAASLAPSIEFEGASIIDIPNYNPSVDINSIGVPRTTSPSSYDPFTATRHPMRRPSEGLNIDPENIPFTESYTHISRPSAPNNASAASSFGSFRGSAFDDVASGFFASNAGEDVSSAAFEMDIDKILLSPDINNIQIMQLYGRYLSTIINERFAIIDISRAVERIAYERFKTTITSGAIASQMELMPEQIELSHKEARLLVDHSEELQKMGFDIADMGGGVVTLYALPAYLAGKVSAHKIIQDLVESFEGSSIDMPSGDDNIAIILAKIAVGDKRHTTLTNEQAVMLVKDLIATSEPTYTPSSGLPIITIIKPDELEKRFKKR